MLQVGIASFWHVHAMDYARQVQTSSRARVALVWDEDVDRGQAAASQLGVPFEADYDRFLDRVDGVVLTAPTRRHGALLIRAQAAAKPVFCEKVLAVSGREALDIVNAFNRAKMVLVVSLPRLFDPHIATIKQLINQGALGQITSVRTRASHDGAVVGWLPPRFFDADQTGGGAFMDLGAHPVYVANWLLGEPREVSAYFARAGRDRGVDDNATATITYAHGRFAVAETSFVNGRHPSLSVEVYGTGGTLYFGTPRPQIWLNSSQRESEAFSEISPSDLGSLPPSPLDHWLDRVLDQAPALVSDDEIIRLSQVMEAATKSAKTGRLTPILPI